jgi:hypothetical protein
VTLSPRAQDVGGLIEKSLVVPEGKHADRKVKLRGRRKAEGGRRGDLRHADAPEDRAG